MEPLLLVEDKTELRAMLRKALERNGFRVEEAPDGSAAIQKIRAKRYQMVVTDLKMPGASGLDVLRESKQADVTIPVILLTAFGSVEEAVSAMKEGAFDFIQKPVDLDHLKLLVERATRQQEMLRENLVLREEFSARYGFPRIVGESDVMKAVSHQLQRVAPTHSPVLLPAESGTGNELFGHERGAFTGAGNRKAGKIELAQRGTLFLDEIGELPLASQSKLLRVLEERCFERVGGTQSIEVDVRIVVATNRDLAQRIRDKLFREDLYFRISAVPLTIPPLRDRADDIFLLCDHFLEKFGRELNKVAFTLEPDARGTLSAYPWPGNVRELQNALERAAILSDGPEITSDLLPSMVTPIRTESAPQNLLPESFSWAGSLEDVTARAQLHVERVLLENALRECRWNKTRAAEKLGIAPKTLLTKMRATGLEN